jgi:hypothetical protein
LQLQLAGAQAVVPVVQRVTADHLVVEDVKGVVHQVAQEQADKGLRAEPVTVHLKAAVAVAVAVE